MKYLWSFSAAVARRLNSFQQFVQYYNAMQYNAVEEVEEGMSIALPIELQGITMHYDYKAM